MPAQKRKQSTLELTPEMTKKPATSVKHTMHYTHNSKLITPSAIEIVLDLTAKTYTFATPVTVVWKTVPHSGIQPPKTFNRKDGNGTFDKPVGLELIIKANDDANNKNIQILEGMNAAIARVFEEQCKEKLGETDRYFGQEVARDKELDGEEVKIIDLSVSKSELQIAGKFAKNKPLFKGPTEISELRKQYAESFPDADQNIMTIPGENGEYLTYLGNAKKYYDDIFEMISMKLPEPTDWKYAQFQPNLINVACNIVGSKVYMTKQSTLYNVKPNVYLDRISVLLDEEFSNGDNAKWAMRFYVPKISIEHLEFLEDTM